jgi:3-oxoacyl-[acyl-carrier-protein] synthase II
MRRVVITGLGTVNPCGLDVKTTWQCLKEGRSGIAPITAFDASEHASKIAGECKGFDPERHVPKRDVRSMDRFIHLSIAASDEVMADAGVALEDPVRVDTGTLIGVGIGGLAYIENTTLNLAQKGPNKITPYFVPASISNLAPGHISMKHRLQGVSYTITSACASGAHAIGEAFRTIVRGELEACVAGGAEAAISPLGVAGFAAMRALSKRNEEPTRASRPWDVDRDGFVIAEGAALLFLEELEHAQKRGAKIYAEVVGYGASADAYHLTQPAPEGAGAQRAMRAALRDAKLNPEQIDYVNAHGTSTPVGDLLELEALRAVFGEHALQSGARAEARAATHKLWVSSTKSMTGHLLGAAGGLEALICALSISDGIVPPTINLDKPAPEADRLDLVPHESRRRPVTHVLSNSFGFGGTNASLVLKRFEG